jgi:hypothetical protein
VELTREQKNDLFRAVEASGLDVTECSLVTRNGEPAIVHERSGSYAEIRQHFYDNMRIRLRAKLGKKAPFAGYSVTGFVHDHYVELSKYTSPWWENVLGDVKEWGSAVAAWLANLPDLWADLKEAKEWTARVRNETPENTPFTPAEQAQISNQLREIKASLRENFDLTAEQLSEIGERLDEAEEASHRLGRKDWVLLFTGTAFSLIIAGTVTPDVAHHMLTMALHGLSHLFLGGAKPISGPHAR